MQNLFRASAPILACVSSFLFSPHVHYNTQEPSTNLFALSAVNELNYWSHHKPLWKLVGPWAPMIRHAAHKAKIPSTIVAAVFWVENGGDLSGCANRVSYAGAIGPMQLMPATAWQVLHVNPWNPQQNIDGGAKFLATLLKTFHGRLRLALMAYNAGPTTISSGYRPIQSVVYARRVVRVLNTRLQAI